MKYRVLAMLLLVTACGGGGDDEGNGGGNLAIDHEFEYGSPAPASAAESNVLMSAIANVQSVRSTPGAGAATALASFQTVTQQLLGAPGVASLRAGKPVPQTFEDCITVTATSVTFDNCVTTSGGTTSVTDGNFTVLDGGATMSWELRIDVESDSSGYHSEISLLSAGDITTSATAIQGTFRSEITVSLTGSGYAIAYGLSEALLADLSFVSTSACVTSGTLEARRVWTQRPSGVPATTYPDRGVQIIWTGCNQATIARSR